MPGDVKNTRFEVATEWDSWRQCKECACGKTFDLMGSMGIHCRKCGHMYCIRCISIRRALPGHYSQRSVPICNACHQGIEDIEGKV